MNTLYPRAHFYLLATFIGAIFAFWPVYFGIIADVRLNLHFHTITAMTWVALLVTQPILILRGRLDLHRKMGQLTYLAAPLFITFNLILFHDFLNAKNPFVDNFGRPIFFYDIVGLGYFTTAYLLAVTKFKKQRQIHARLMLSTIFLMMFPVVARLFLFYFSFGMSVNQIFHLSLFLIDALLILLIVREWRQGKIYWVFPVLLAVTLLQHIGYTFANDWTAWNMFAGWYAAL